MKRSHLFLLSALLASATMLPAQSPSASPADARVRGHVEFLASDLLEGRDTGSRGHEIAASYVATQFGALGLVPAGENGGWYQWVPFRKATLVAAKSRIELIGADGKVQPIDSKNMIARPSLNEKIVDLTAPLVFVGYGLDDAKLGLDDYAGLDVRGKIVVAFSGVPDGFSSDISAHLGEIKAARAAARGAAGFIQVSPKAPKNADAPLPPFLATIPSTDWVEKDGTAGSTPRGLRARASVSQRAADLLFAGAPRSLAAVRAAAAKKGARPKGFALKPSLKFHTESEWSEYKSPEVVAKLPGADPRLAGEHVAMMGHLDHVGIKPNAKPGEDAIYNGALDNAAGVATLIEAARHFVDSGKAPRRSILFVVHTGEEKGLLGASYFAHHPTVPLSTIVGGVDLDMPVPLYKFSDVVAFGAEHSSIAETVAEAGATMGVTVSPDPMPQEAIFTRSDHYRFVEKGIPAILLFTGYGGGGKDKFENFMAKNYHKVSDDLSQPIMWDQLARYADLNYRIARRLADQDRRPLWYQGNYFGDYFAAGSARAPAPAKK